MISKGDKGCVSYVLEQWYAAHSLENGILKEMTSFCEKSEPEQKELIASAIKDRNKQSTSIIKYTKKLSGCVEGTEMTQSHIEMQGPEANYGAEKRRERTEIAAH
ncbi:hypothetical protein TNCV_4607471 [Trichonephila clavipes]|nr:hypothetical protein TNCV_4607471 [Trichonephila clavipes]